MARHFKVIVEFLTEVTDTVYRLEGTRVIIYKTQEEK